MDTGQQDNQRHNASDTHGQWKHKGRNC